MKGMDPDMGSVLEKGYGVRGGGQSGEGEMCVTREMEDYVRGAAITCGDGGCMRADEEDMCLARSGGLSDGGGSVA